MAEISVEEDDNNESVPRKSLSEDEIIKTLMSPSSVSLRDLIPSGPIKSKNAVKVALWILSKNSQKKSQTSILQRIKWLTAVVQYGIVDSLTELQQVFNPLIQLIYISQFQASVCHLLYMLATPNLYKFQIERITKNANVVGLTKPLAGLLSRLKSLRPDLVPQTIPHQSNAVSFPKAPASIRNGFYALSERLKERHELPSQVTFIDEKEKKRVTKRMRLDIVPRVQQINLKSSFEVDFRKMVLLSQFQTFDDLVNKITKVELPNHIGSLLGKRDYHYVLAVNFSPHIEALLSQWLYVTLYHEFMEKPQTEGKEGKAVILDRIVEFQQSTGFKLMAVYDFLSEYLRVWDGVQYHPQIFQLLSEIPFLPYSDLYANFLKILEELYHSSNTRHRLRILDTCQKLIFNLMLQKFGPSDEAKLLFKDSTKSASRDNVTMLVEGIYVVSEVIRFTERLLNTALTSSSDITLVSESLLFYTWLIEVESEYQLPFRTICQPITVYMAFFSPTPVTISLLCQLLCKYSELGRKQLMTMSPLPEMEEFHRDSLENASMLNRYVTDISNCLIYEKAFTSDGNSLLSRTPKKILKKLLKYGSVKGAFALKRHPAFTGVARMWIKSKANESNRVFEEIDRDPEGFIRYLFGSFPAIQNYLQEFHIGREDNEHVKQ